mmetsp:Transcript_94156/g.266433  ORF Transcript_94156/g.266433 Transcript_94156/m.266433 type:complete len:358 (-) Transcript_94156:214-1287(-)
MAVGAPEQLPASARAAPEPDPEGAASTPTARRAAHHPARAPHDPGEDASPTGEPLDELERLQNEYSELKNAAAERGASDGVTLHDAQLLRLKLSGLLQRYQERPQNIEDLAEHYEGTIRELTSEVLQLRQENASLAMQEPPVGAKAQQPRARTAVDELCAEVCRLRLRHAEHQERERRAQLEEWRLDRYQDEARHVVRQLKVQERRFDEFRGRHAGAEGYLHDLAEELAQGQADTERERAAIQELNREEVRLREACYLPAWIKRESGFLMKMLDQEGGRLKTKQHLRSLEVCKRLYSEVVAHAPSLLPLASRAKSEMEAAFTRYLQLEEAHSRALQRLHFQVTRELVRDRGWDGPIS